MKRIKAACICQTLHFAVRENLPYNTASKLVKIEFNNYIHRLERTCTKYKILEKTEQPDGSLIVKVKRQNNMSPVGEYLD